MDDQGSNARVQFETQPAISQTVAKRITRMIALPREIDAPFEIEAVAVDSPQPIDAICLVRKTAIDYRAGSAGEIHRIIEGGSRTEWQRKARVQEQRVAGQFFWRAGERDKSIDPSDISGVKSDARGASRGEPDSVICLVALPETGGAHEAFVAKFEALTPDADIEIIAGVSELQAIEFDAFAIRDEAPRRIITRDVYDAFGFGEQRQPFALRHLDPGSNSQGRGRSPCGISDAAFVDSEPHVAKRNNIDAGAGFVRLFRRLREGERRRRDP
ncbi:MAG: hypothetical protein JHD35_13925 [Sphingopyxis sp.]|nr:hypothetical protein [Sphingopyxis sp.]